MMKHLAVAALFLAMASSGASAQVNAGEQKSEPNLPFNVTEVTTLRLPWKIAFLPDGRMLITEKVGGMQLVTQQGAKTPVANTPAVLWKGQGGMLGVYLSPHYAKDHNVYLTYSEPGDGGSSLALARARLKISGDTASLEGLKVIWRDGERGEGGQFGAEVAFSPDSKYLFLSVGERQRFTPAQDPNQPLGKILRLTLDGKPAPAIPWPARPARPLCPSSTRLRIPKPPRRPLSSERIPFPARTSRLRRHGPPVSAPPTAWPLGPMDGCGRRNMVHAAATN